MGITIYSFQMTNFTAVQIMNATKGLYSSFNSENMFEIIHSLIRQFGPENWSLYKDKHLLNFVDNHDVTRIADLLNVSEHLPLYIWVII